MGVFYKSLMNQGFISEYTCDIYSNLLSFVRMAYFLIFLISIGIVALLVWMFKENEVDKEYLKAQKERLEDDRVYDPETGAFYTVEEIEQGIVHEKKDPYALFSDEEIEISFFNDQEFPLIHNQLIREGYVADHNNVFFDAMFSSSLCNYFDFCEHVRSYRISGISSLYLLQCNYKIKGQFVWDTYIFGLIEIGGDHGHHVLRETNSQALLSRIIDRKTEQLTLKNWTINCFEGAPNEELFEDVILCFPNKDVDGMDVIDATKTFAVTVEIKGAYLFFKANRSIDPDQTDSALMCFRNLESTFG